MQRIYSTHLFSRVKKQPNQSVSRIWSRKRKKIRPCFLSLSKPTCQKLNTRKKKIRGPTAHLTPSAYPPSFFYLLVLWISCHVRFYGSSCGASSLGKLQQLGLGEPRQPVKTIDLTKKGKTKKKKQPAFSEHSVVKAWTFKEQLWVYCLPVSAPHFCCVWNSSEVIHSVVLGSWAWRRFLEDIHSKVRIPSPKKEKENVPGKKDRVTSTVDYGIHLPPRLLIHLFPNHDFAEKYPSIWVKLNLWLLCRE